MQQIEKYMRHYMAVALFLLVLVAIGAARSVSIQTSLSVVAFELIALWLVYLVLYVFSPINFLNIIVQYYNGDHREIEKLYVAAYIVIATIVAVHLLVGGCVFGIYFTAARPMP